MEVFTVLVLLYFASISVGYFLERFHIPWLFAPLFLGIFFKIFGLSINDISILKWLADVGMFFLLFMIGFELEIKKIRRLGKFILFATFLIILLDAFFGSIVVHSFGYSWIIACITALSFATVGEAVLLPILDEVKVLKTRLGTMILGIGILDDAFEIFVIMFSTLLITGIGEDVFFPLISTLLLLTVSFFIPKLKTLKRSLRKVPKMEDFFLLTLLTFFLFLTVGSLGRIEALGSILAGICLRFLLTKKPLQIIEEGLKMIGYGFFALIFFFWIGYSMDLNSLTTFPLLALSIFSVSVLSKVLSSILTGLAHNLSLKESFLLGIGLSVRFSTGIIITQLLYVNKLIDSALFTSIIAASTLSTLLVPIVFSLFLNKWKKVLV